MKIILNGGLYVNEEEIFFDGLEIQIDNEQEINCCDCEDYYDDYEYEDYLEDYSDDEENLDEEYVGDDYICAECAERFEELVEEYAEIIAESDGCEDCIKIALRLLIGELL